MRKQIRRDYDWNRQSLVCSELLFIHFPNPISGLRMRDWKVESGKWRVEKRECASWEKVEN